MEKEKLKIFLENWISSLIKKELSDLVNLKNTNTKNNYARALCFRLFENNGIIKRDLINQITKNIPQEERLNLRKKGVKIGRYHIFLPQMRLHLESHCGKYFFKIIVYQFYQRLV